MKKPYYDLIMDELDKTLKKISTKDTQKLMDMISGSSRIFITGKGRTGFIMNTFAIRLMQMGFKVHVLGEPSSPSIREDDLLLLGSGSGETESLVAITSKARKIGSKIAIITMNGESSIAKKADAVLVIPAKGSKLDKDSVSDSIQPMCNLFEQSLLIFLDLLSMLIMDQKNIDLKILYEKHANLE